MSTSLVRHRATAVVFALVVAGAVLACGSKEAGTPTSSSAVKQAASASASGAGSENKPAATAANGAAAAAADPEIHELVATICKEAPDREKAAEKLKLKGERAVVELASALATHGGEEKPNVLCRFGVYSALADAGPGGLREMLKGLMDPVSQVRSQICSDIGKHAEEYRGERALKAAAIDAFAHMAEAGSLPSDCKDARSAITGH